MNSPTQREATGLAAMVVWMARNNVASNLLMFLLVGGGIAMMFIIKQEVFPSFQLNIVDIRISYPGASPEEVEDGVILAVEEEIRGLDVVERIVSTADEGGANVEVELIEGVDPNRALQDINNAVDSISSLPDDVERPRIALRKEQENVMWLVVYGPFTEHQVFDLAEKVRRDLVALPEISQVEVSTQRDPEISIEIPQARLRSLGLTLGEVADIIRVSARDIPAGGVRTSAGEILLRTRERRDFASEYGDIVLVSAPGGSDVLLRDVALIRDGFEDRPGQNLFNGGRGIFITIYESGDENPIDIADQVYGYIEQLELELPPGAGIQVMRDRAEQYRDRLHLLLEDGIFGLILVVITLGLFLAPRLAFWVATGVPIAAIGSLLLLPLADASINMISLFAFIITLGIVVDEAVIIGENVFHKMEQGLPRLQAAIEGASEMVVPVVFAVGTNIIAFVPLMFVPGETGRFFAPLPAVVIAVFLISLVEALFVLPAHLGHGREGREEWRAIAWLGRQQQKVANGFDRLTDLLLVPLLHGCVRHRYLALSILFGGLGLVYAYYASGRIDYTFNPVITGLRVDAEIETPVGSAMEDTIRVANHVERAGLRVADRLGGRDKVLGGRMNTAGRGGENRADVNFYLVEPDSRNFSEGEFARQWREEVGEVPGMKSLYFEWEEGPGSGAGLTVELSHPDREILEAAATSLADELATFSGVSDINDGFSTGKAQIDVQLTAQGLAMGLTPEFVGRQVRHAFYGAEALRFQRERHEVRVMVRGPKSERESLANVQDLIIRTPEGGETPLAQIAHLKFGKAFTEINRVDTQRVFDVTCNIDPAVVNINTLRASLDATVLPGLTEKYSGLTYEFSGRQREERRAIDSLKLGLIIASIVIFGMLAAVFRSYGQAVIVMLTVPFAAAAALLGHIAMGYDLSIVSVFGMISLAGLVVNGGMVLFEELNRLVQEEGFTVEEAAVAAGRRRFRPIFLTSLTTFAGLAPMIMETSSQAKFLVPMAIAIAFGTLMSAPIVMMLPACLAPLIGRPKVEHAAERPAAAPALRSPLPVGEG